MHRRSIAVVAALILALMPSAGVLGRPTAPPSLSTLEPGGFRTIQQDLTINVVFVGYEQGAGPRDIDEAAFLAGLPSSYTTVSRSPRFYGLPGELGLEFAFDYNLVYAGSAFEDAFFGYLDGIAQPMPLTLFQELYNEQVNRSLDVTENAWIDAPSTEQWLAGNAGPLLGVDTSQYTIFYVNWYGRSDFRFHVYTKIDEPDPDTGYNFGVQRETRKIIAWGGTTPDDEENGLGSLHRIWFYDLSAGPESWTDNWNVDDADLDGNEQMDYRMPPIWEYGSTSGYRPFDDLTGDLAKITRYVAIDLLFTTSPLYKPAISGPDLPSDIELDINVYQGEPGVDGRAFIDTGLVIDELTELQPLNTFSTEVNAISLSGRARNVYLCWLVDDSCFGNKLFGIAFADLFLYHNDHLLQYVDGDGDYEVPIFAYNTTDDLAAGFLGYADDNWRDGTQSFVFGFDSPAIRDAGYGLTTTLIHEVGHHVGLSHPHDGYDAEADVDFGPGDEFYFAWSGDESNSMMSYIDLNWDFSQFDRDNMNRYLTAVYINQANAILEDIYASPRAGQVTGLLTSADAAAADALAEHDAMNYAVAVDHAKQAYETVLRAAAQIKVQVEPQASSADYKAKGRSDKFVDELSDKRLN
jgi:hypothetical protein